MTALGHYRIPNEPGGTGSLILALLVHLLLIGFLWIGVSWQSQDTGGVEAEIWDTQYREAAPRGPAQPEPKVQEKAPPPAEAKPAPEEQVAKADIALERKKKREEAKKKEEEEKRQKQDDSKRKKAEAEQKKRDLADSQARAKGRAAELRRIVAGIAGAGKGGGTGGRGRAERSTGNIKPSRTYEQLVGAIIRSNTSYFVPNNLDGNPSVEYAITLLPDGSLRSRPRKVKSSGLPGFDEAVLRAIQRSEPFPPDESGKVPHSMTVVHKPKD